MEDFDRHISDRELLEDFAKRGHEDSFNVLVQDYKLRLFNVAFRVLHDRHAAEDAIQRVLITLLEQKDQLADVESLQAWLYRTTLNVSLNMKKSRQRRKEREKAGDASREGESPRDAAAKAELREELDGALGKLKDSLRIPVVLRYLQGLSHAETGEILNLSPDAIRMRIGRALKKLRRLLGKRGLLVSTLAVEEGLGAIPAEAASVGFLTSASSLIKAGSTVGIAAKAALTTTSIIKGGLMMTAKAKIAIGVGAAILAGGTLTYFATKGDHVAHVTPSPKREAAPRREAVTRAITEQIPVEEIGLFGYVVDAEGNAVGGANVEAGVFEGESPDSLKEKLSVQSMTTNSNGDFRFSWDAFSEARELLAAKEEPSEEGPKQRQSVIAATKEGYVPARESLDVASPTPPSEALVLVLRRRAEVSGKVVWKETREPITRTEVLCRPDDYDVHRSTQAKDITDDDGNFSFTASFEGTGVIQPWLSRHGYSYLTYDTYDYAGLMIVELRAGQTVAGLVLEVGLLSDTLIEGNVVNAEGKPVAGARVQLSSDKAMSPSTTSEEDGWYRLIVGRDWPYQSYYVKDWADKPKMSGGCTSGLAGDMWFVFPEDEGKRDLGKGHWDWATYWTPPPNVPPERIVGFHADYELGFTEIHQLGIGQIRRGVDIVLHKGSRVSGKVLDDTLDPIEGVGIGIGGEAGGKPRPGQA